jgi:Kef-type K+ transport system membrane component KefB
VTFPLLALIGLAALLGPVLAAASRWRVPIVLGELLAGIVIGASGLHLVSSSNATFTFLADVGFALVMFVAGSHVPVRDASIRPALLGGLARVVFVGALAAAVGIGIASLFHTGHPALFAVLMTSSSAALVLPTLDGLGLGGPKIVPLLAQVAIADTLSIVALPLAIDPVNAPRAAFGALLIAVCAVALFLILRTLVKVPDWTRLRKVQHERHLALELRISLVVLFALASLAVSTHVSIMLAGFAAGLAVAGVGEPRRLTRQLFALSDGFLGPLFFVWLGSSLSLGSLFKDPRLVLLGLALGAGAVLVHLAMRITRQPLPLGATASAQLGVPVAAATIGKQLGVLAPGEPAALILGALVTIAALAISTAIASRNPAYRAPAKKAAAAGPEASPS